MNKEKYVSDNNVGNKMTNRDDELLKSLQELKKKMQETVIDFKDADYILIIPTHKASSFMDELEENTIYTIEPDGKTKAKIYGIEFGFEICKNMRLMNKEEYKKKVDGWWRENGE